MRALNKKQTMKDTLTQTTVSLSLEACPEEK